MDMERRTQGQGQGGGRSGSGREAEISLAASALPRALEVSYRREECMRSGPTLTEEVEEVDKDESDLRDAIEGKGAAADGVRPEVVHKGSHAIVDLGHAGQLVIAAPQRAQRRVALARRQEVGGIIQAKLVRRKHRVHRAAMQPPLGVFHARAARRHLRQGRRRR